MQYKWIVLSNTTLGTLMASLDTNIVLIALPTISRELRATSFFDLLSGPPRVPARQRLAPRELRPPLGHVRAGQALHLRVRALHRRLGALQPGPDRRAAHRLQAPSGRRLGLPLLKQRRHNHRRFPAGGAGEGARDQPGLHSGRLTARASPGRSAHHRGRLAVHLLRQHPNRDLRNNLVSLSIEGARR